MKKEIKKKINRTGKMPCDICKEKNILVIHHIRGRKIPKYNHKSNICDLCSNCHNKIHNGLIIIEDWITTTSGRELIWHKSNEQSLTNRDATPYLIESKK